MCCDSGKWAWHWGSHSPSFIREFCGLGRCVSWAGTAILESLSGTWDLANQSYEKLSYSTELVRLEKCSLWAWGPECELHNQVKRQGGGTHASAEDIDRSTSRAQCPASLLFVELQSRETLSKQQSGHDGEMTQWVKTLVALAEGLDLIPSSYPA